MTVDGGVRAGWWRSSLNVFILFVVLWHHEPTFKPFFVPSLSVFNLSTCYCRRKRKLQYQNSEVLNFNGTYFKTCLKRLILLKIFIVTKCDKRAAVILKQILTFQSRYWNLEHLTTELRKQNLPSICNFQTVFFYNRLLKVWGLSDRLKKSNQPWKCHHETCCYSCSRQDQLLNLHRCSSRSSSLPAGDNKKDLILSVSKSSEMVKLKAMAGLPSSTHSTGDKTGDNLLMKVNRGAAAAARRWIASIYRTR